MMESSRQMVVLITDDVRRHFLVGPKNPENRKAEQNAFA